MKRKSYYKILGDFEKRPEMYNLRGIHDFLYISLGVTACAMMMGKEIPDEDYEDFKSFPGWLVQVSGNQDYINLHWVEIISRLSKEKNEDSIDLFFAYLNQFKDRRN